MDLGIIVFDVIVLGTIEPKVLTNLWQAQKTTTISRNVYMSKSYSIWMKGDNSWYNQAADLTNFANRNEIKPDSKTGHEQS